MSKEEWIVLIKQAKRQGYTREEIINLLKAMHIEADKDKDNEGDDIIYDRILGKGVPKK